MPLPARVLIRQRIQISDDGERIRPASKSLKEEDSRLHDLRSTLGEDDTNLSWERVVPPRQAERLRMSGTRPLRQHLILAMQGRGTMLTKAIYCAVKEHCDGVNRPLPSNWQSDIRQILQAQCASRPQYKGGANTFIYHRRGHWSCTAEPASI